MGIHYTLHHPTYINDLNAAVEGTGFAEWPEQLRAAAILKAPWLRRSMSNWTNVLLSIRMAVIAGGDVALLCAWLVSLAELLLPLGLALAAGAMLLIGFCLMIVMDTALD